jgi:hypothetical protein
MGCIDVPVVELRDLEKTGDMGFSDRSVEVLKFGGQE